MPGVTARLTEVTGETGPTPPVTTHVVIHDRIYSCTVIKAHTATMAPRVTVKDLSDTGHKALMPGVTLRRPGIPVIVDACLRKSFTECLVDCFPVKLLGPDFGCTGAFLGGIARGFSYPLVHAVKHSNKPCAVAAAMVATRLRREPRARAFKCRVAF